VNTTTDVLAPAIGKTGSLGESATVSVAKKHLVVLSQLLLALLVTYLYSVENTAFFRVFALATAGFAVNLVLPMRLRLPFFALLSIGGVFAVFGAADGLWLIGCGLVLIGLCHLPLSVPARVAVLLVAGGGLAVSRGGLFEAPWSAAVWPILGSMFMFRLVLYMLAMKNGKQEGGIWNALAYFFMLPNLVFPLYPVVDYQTFRRTYYDRQEHAIYEQGMVWIVRGVVHLLLYRFVYHSVLNDPGDVIGLGDLVQFMLGTFLLYLRVSGQFHLIVGLLHLFGFRLPETHKLYYLAHSFTELWRRINIYWTEFMMKAVFYPTYFKVKKLGPSAALVISTTAVFVTTWVLHSYQWFWLRGGFPLTLQDTLFWGMLGALVVWGALKELKAVRKPKGRVAGFSWSQGLKAATTFAAFCFLWSLWSAQSVGQWVWMIGAATNVDVKGVVLLFGTFGLLVALGGRNWDAPRAARPAWLERAFSPAVRTFATLAILIAAAQPSAQAVAPRVVASGLQSMQTTGLNARDAALQHRGYYEQLEVRGTVNAQVLDVVGRNGEAWDDPSTVGILRTRKDLMLRDLEPSKSVEWNGNTFTTNTWGMRDQEYTREKPARTLRVALLGPSHVMGNGVSDGQTFESLVEARLNRQFKSPRYDRIEILNFGVDGYSVAQQVAMLEERALSFSPDIVIATHYHPGRFVTEAFILKVIWGDIPVPHDSLKALFARAGLDQLNRHGSMSVPFGPVRSVASWFGLNPRMPYGESEARSRWISEDVLAWSFQRFAEVSKRGGATPLVLALNAVVDDAPADIPNRRDLDAAGLKVLDLYHVYPEADHAALRVAPWDDHPNAAGHRLIADRLYEELVGVLESGTVDASASMRTTASNGPTRPGAGVREHSGGSTR
jgi:D-alanyl-lipoteichoic acid acyltransferase DltB (MBOAT superfamily)